MRRILLIALCIVPIAHARSVQVAPAHTVWAAPLGRHLNSELLIAPMSSHGRTAWLEGARMRRVRRLIRRFPNLVASGPDGDPIVRGQVLALDPSLASIRHALAAGFSLAQSRPLTPLGIRLVLLHTPRGLRTAQALVLLHEIDPGGTYVFNQIYTDTGTMRGARARAANRSVPTASPARAQRTAGRGAVGLIDGGVDLSHPALREARVRRHGCSGTSIPSAYGTAIASLLVGHSKTFSGAVPGAELFAADVICGRPTGGSVSAIAAAFAWLVRERVPVIDVALVGPPNALLREVIERVHARGILIVAAVGDDGPREAPLYPAAYPGVIGVTAVNQDRQVPLAAQRGPQVMFAAPGVNIAAARMPRGYTAVRGTSFASAWVAGLLAARLRAPGMAAARAALESLIRQAIPLGLPGRNPIVGYGLVGAGLARPW